MTARALGVALLLAACGDNGHTDIPTPPDGAVDPPDPGVVPRIEPATCKFTVDPSLGVSQGTDYTCGDLVVFENRVTKGRTIRLHFIQFKKAADIAASATIYLDGGPGGDGSGILAFAGFLGKPFLDGLMTSGDFLVIGQRGTALSQPFLDCQAPDCSDFASVADPRMYNTANNADDVDELRATLGYQTLDLYGISYGSRLGLEVIRRHGDKLRSATIEGLVPSQVNWEAAVPSSFYSALTGLNASCSAAGACGTEYGNLEAKFISGVDTLNTNPVPVNTSQGSFDLDGNTYAFLLFQMFYSKSTYPYLPMMISDLAARRTDRIGPVLSAILGNDFGGGISTGLYYGVVCSELFNPPNEAAFDEANVDVPAPIRDLYSGGWFGMLQQCADYPKADASLQTELQQPVTSSVRTFVSSGRLDPITPPTFGALAASNLSDSFHVIHENSGHGATLQSQCGQHNLFTFLADPTTPVDTSCAATISGDFLVGQAFAARPVPVARIRAELSIAPIPASLRRKH